MPKGIDEAIKYSWVLDTLEKLDSALEVRTRPKGKVGHLILRSSRLCKNSSFRLVPLILYCWDKTRGPVPVYRALDLRGFPENNGTEALP